MNHVNKSTNIWFIEFNSSEKLVLKQIFNQQALWALEKRHPDHLTGESTMSWITEYSATDCIDPNLLSATYIDNLRCINNVIQK